MAKTKMRLRHIDKRKIYRAVNASWIKRKLCPQQSPRCTSVVLISDTSGSMGNLELNEISREEIKELVEALKTMLEKCLREHPEPCTAIRCDGQLYYGKKGIARSFYLVFHRNLDLFSRTRLLYHLQELIREMRKSRLSEKRFAQWYREGPPNNQVFCHTLNTVA